eukprot:s4511_g10.t1
MPSALTWEAVLVSNKHIHVVLAVGGRVYLVNRTDSEQALEGGTLIAGWFKGRFWQHRSEDGEAPPKKSRKGGNDNEAPSNADILFQLEDAGSHVSFEAKIRTVGSLLLEQRKKMPEAKIAYHHLNESPKAGNPTWFDLTLKNHIYFRTEGIPTKEAPDGSTTPKISMGHLGGCLKPEMWNTTCMYLVVL